jgi:hypothetical protein
MNVEIEAYVFTYDSKKRLLSLVVVSDQRNPTIGLGNGIKTKGADNFKVQLTIVLGVS